MTAWGGGLEGEVGRLHAVGIEAGRRVQFGELRVVEGVVTLESKLSVPTLGKLHLAVQGDIPIIHAGTSQRVHAEVAESADQKSAEARDCGRVGSSTRRRAPSDGVPVISRPFTRL